MAKTATAPSKTKSNGYRRSAAEPIVGFTTAEIKKMESRITELEWEVVELRNRPETLPAEQAEENQGTEQKKPCNCQHTALANWGEGLLLGMLIGVAAAAIIFARPHRRWIGIQ